MKKERDDSHFWRIDRACAEAGNEAVVLTGRKLSPEQEGKLTFSGAKVVSTRGER